MLAGLPALLAHFAQNDQMDIAVLKRVLQRQFNNQNFTYRDILLLGRMACPSRRPSRCPGVAAFPCRSRRDSRNWRNAAAACLSAVRSRTPRLVNGRSFSRECGPLSASGRFSPSPRFRPFRPRVLSAAGEPDGVRTTLERDDGVLLTSVPHDETRIGQRIEPPARQLASTHQATITAIASPADRLRARSGPRSIQHSSSPRHTKWTPRSQAGTATAFAPSPCRASSASSSSAWHLR